MIRITTQKDIPAVLDIHRLAFEEEDEAILVGNLLDDETAHPLLSLVMEEDDEILGHILFTKACVAESDVCAMLLAPLAVHPDRQYKGIGQRLMKEGFRQLAAMGVELVFVLGDPAYYPRVGFVKDAGALGFATPQPIPSQYREAWMVKDLNNGALDRYHGQVRVADQISAREYWSD